VEHRRTGDDDVAFPVALTMAGSDSGGGAGIQADLKTFQAFGVFGTSAVTALTAQNTVGVHAVHAAPARHVRTQIEVVVEDLQPAACKTGMLASAELVETVASAIRATGLPNYVLDPVMVATSGDRLLAEDAETAVLELLLPLCTLATPNLHEAELLAGEQASDEAGMRRLAEMLVNRGAAAVLVKGGHLEGSEVVDVLFDGTSFRSWRRPKLDTTNTHGTGCTLSAGIAAGLARGWTLTEAVEAALDFTHRAIAQAPGLGRGHGPLNHWVEVHPPHR
jgi:hydroxymethylpyrimidine/phosphomethylpyrimidine kinase